MTVAVDIVSSVWIASLHAKSQPRRTATAKYDGLGGLGAVPNGRVLFRSLESGTPQIWIMDADGSNRRQLTTDGSNSWPQASPDGQYIVFVSQRSEGTTLWRMNTEGGGATQLAAGGPASSPVVSPDGKWVVYTSTQSGVESLWRVPLLGGRAEQLTTAFSIRPAISPDGTRIACFHRVQPDASPQIAVIPFDGGPPIARFPGGLTTYSTVRWTTDGKALLHNAGSADRANVWSQPLDGGAAAPVTRYTELDIFTFDRTADGRSLLLARGLLTRDAVLIRDFR